MRKLKKPAGRKKHVTAEVVKRVGERVGLGIPLRLSLILEKDPCINPKSWEKALQRNPAFVGAFEAEKADFLERSYRRLASHNDWRALVSLLEHRHAVDFAKPTERVEVTSPCAALTLDALAAVQSHAAAKQPEP